ncbi:hypothetical protein SAMN05660199_01830 [Klenkia soli]|uniref:DUF559 domain-containing protein n=1 Tax=Klenkia soli TaxID=1052260 RepID=A0A1H0J0A1_9ACTN|nr:hypothetical protein [Klenkia soli]SDO37198.1 hypothetical protein SAMN05660199_01830 [Klenkia soli]
MPVPPAVPPALVGRVFRGSDVVRRGILTAAQLRSSAWRRIRHDVYVDTAVPDTHLVRAAAVALLVPSGAAFGGLTAAALWGVPDLVDADDPVEVVVPTGVRWSPAADVVVRTAELAGGTERRHGLPVTDRRRTAVDLARRQRWPTAWPSRRRRRGPGWSCASAGCRRRWLSTGWWSRAGSWLRLPQQRAALEYDGVWHAEAGQFARDRARLNALQAAGWRVVFVTARDLHHPEELVARVLAALAA